MKALILAGGSGTRFWPKSREGLPKQFLCLTHPQRSLLQLTVERINKFVSYEDIFVVTKKGLAEKVREQLPELQEKNLIIEPVGRNTAPAIGYASLKINQLNPRAKLIILPADHLIREEKKFFAILKLAEEIIEEDCLITLGIKPSRGETGYGYLELGGGYKRKGVHEVLRFVEKPNANLAREFLASHNFFWNSGIFIARVDVILESIEKFLPSLAKGLREIEASQGLASEKTVTQRAYQAFETISFDYGVMEKAKNVLCLPVEMGWDDLGSWASVLDLKKSEGLGNTISLKSENCLIEAGQKLVATIGIKDLIIVDTPDALLVCHKDETQGLKEVVEEIKRLDLKNYL